MTTFEIIVGGITALLGPGYGLALPAVLLVGVLLGSRQPRVAVFSGALALLLLLAAQGARAGLIPAATFPSWLALGPLVLFAELARRHGSAVAWWWGGVTGLATAFLVVLWRVDRFGPVLASLRGGWQADPARSDIALYHLASGLGLALVFVVAAEFGRIVGDARLRHVRWIFWGVAMLLVLSQRVESVNDWMLLKWPAWRVG